ncbi:MAG: DUF3526 domain-containing protein [Planctomycetota bacterium]
MKLSIARKEFVETWRDGRFIIAAVIVLALLGVSLVLAKKQVESAREERETAAKMERDNWLNQGKKSAHSAGHYGVYAFKPVSPLAAFDRGLEPYVGTTVFLEAHRQNPSAFLPAQDATSMRRFGELTASIALQLLAPLLIILLTFSTLAGERERGTLRQVLSLGVKPRDLVVGKAIGLGAALLVLFVPVAVIGAVVLLQLAPEGSGDFGQRVGYLTLAYGLYFAAFLALSLSVSALASNARTALVVLLLLWAVNGVLAPRLSTDLVERVKPLPSLEVFEQNLGEEIKSVQHGHGLKPEITQALLKKTLEKYGVSNPRELPINFRGVVLLESERVVGEIYDRHNAELWDQIEAQDRWVSWCGLASPLLGLRSASMAFSGTDFAHHRDFSVAAEAYRRDFVRVLNEEEMRVRPGTHGPPADRELWEQLPAFSYATPPVATALASGTAGLTVLAIWAALAWFLLISVAPRIKPN